MRDCSVFTYGTLEVPEVMEAVTGNGFISMRATTEGYARYLLKGRIFPGMTPASGHVTSGRVYFGLTHQDLTLLDKFEDPIYVRQLIPVRTDEGQWCSAYAYIIEPKDQEILSSDPWVREAFVEDHLASYLVACRHFQVKSRHSRFIQSPSS